jgi:hypothetical protein
MNMKPLHRPLILLVISIALALISFAFSSPAVLQNTRISEYTGAIVLYQTTATPEVQEDRSEIGSTDYITIASFAITAIIIIPIMLKRKSWAQD